MVKQIRTIPATLDQNTSKPLGTEQKRKVAGYARVSTDNEDQINSYEAQIDYYTEYIKSHKGWDFVDIYTDDGVSGTSTAKRVGFNTMIKDALAGKIDLIVTKSVSRFARNTVDSLTTIRTLKENGIEVYFEKENIWTFDSSGELLLTIMSSISQEESRSISLNVTWGIRKGMQDGKVHVAYSNFLGFDRGEDGNLVINKEQAEVVRKIYAFYIQGLSYKYIAQKLTQEGIPTPAGCKNWSASTIESILKNEKFKGDALLQKTFTTSFLTKKKKINEGEIPQYYVEGNHEAIIEPVVFDWVQEQTKKRTCRYSSKYLFCSKIYCGECGSGYGRKKWHSGKKYSKFVWMCNGKYKFAGKNALKYGKDFKPHICPSPVVHEEDVQVAFLKAVNAMLKGREKSIAAFELAKATVLDTSELEIDLATVNAEIHFASARIKWLDEKNFRDSYEIDVSENALNETRAVMRLRIVEAKKKQHDLKKRIVSKKKRIKAIDEYISQLKAHRGRITDFSAELFSSLVDHITVKAGEYNKEWTFTFMDETEIIVKA